MRYSQLTLVAVVGVMALACPLQAADLSVPSGVGNAQIQGSTDCGPCGCLSVVFDYHRELQSTYGLDYDPRNYDTTEPHFYLGPMRAYPRYLIDGEPVYTHSC